MCKCGQKSKSRAFYTGSLGNEFLCQWVTLGSSLVMRGAIYNLEFQYSTEWVNDSCCKRSLTSKRQDESKSLVACPKIKSVFT